MNLLMAAEQLGYEVSYPEHWVSPCPVCGQQTRHRKSQDARGAVWVDPVSYDRFKCIQCDIAGTGKKFMELHKRYSATALPPGATLAGGIELPSLPSRSITAQRPPSYPDQQEVQAYWDQCMPLAGDKEAYDYLHYRYGRPVPDAVCLTDVVRGRHVGHAPEWAGGWTEGCYHLHFPLRDHTGAVRSVIARSVDTGVRVKSRSPSKKLRRGLFMHHQADSSVYVITEGELDYLAWVLFCPQKPSVIGMFSGSLSEDLFKAIPATATVWVATDPDEAGENYYKDVLKYREDAQRWRV